MKKILLALLGIGLTGTGYFLGHNVVPPAPKAMPDAVTGVDPKKQGYRIIKSEKTAGKYYMTVLNYVSKNQIGSFLMLDLANAVQKIDPNTLSSTGIFVPQNPPLPPIVTHFITATSLVFDNGMISGNKPSVQGGALDGFSLNDVISVDKDPTDPKNVVFGVVDLENIKDLKRRP